MERMSNSRICWLGQAALALLATVVVVGCQSNDSAQAFTSVTPVAPPEPKLDLTAPAGVPVAPGTGIAPTQLADSRNFTRRADPFSLMRSEIDFDNAQRTDRILEGANGFAAPVNEPTLDIGGAPDPVLEPVPTWRLSGVIIGNGVLALLDTGSRTYQITPGMTVPGTEWYVVSIDREKAVLARDGSKRPSEFEVGLQGPIGGRGGGAAPAGGTQGGNQAPGGAQGGSGPGGGAQGDR